MFEELFWKALDMPDQPLAALRQVVAELQAQGIDRDTLLWELQGFCEQAARRSPDDETHVLTVMDDLIGWCRPRPLPD